MRELLIILVTAIVVLFAVNIRSKALSWFKRKTRLLKSYWIFSVLFTLFSVTAYLAAFRYISDEAHLDRCINLLNQATTLGFAIFVGYFAFVQVAENRKEKYDDQGYDAMARKYYKKAAFYWEQAHGINKKDAKTLGNLIEAYIIEREFDKAEEKLQLYKKICVDGEKITELHLRAGIDLLRGRLSEASEKIKETVDFTKANASFHKHYGWNFNDIKESGTFKALRGEAKNTYDNFIKYLTNNLSQEQKIMFENGDYLLSKLEKSDS